MNNEVRVHALLAEIEETLAGSRAAAARGELALTLARKLDDGTAGPSTAAVARELRAVIAELEEIPHDGSTSPLEELAFRRRLRLVGLLEQYDDAVAEMGDSGASGRRKRP